MSLNAVPSADRIHIGIFGKRNAGKSSIINAMTGQSLAIVSDIKGTTTDPVLKAMELLPLGPVVLIDTPGLDDEGPLGDLRVKKAYQTLNKTDIAVLVVDGSAGVTQEDITILGQIQKKQIPYVIVWNKSDLSAISGEAEIPPEVSSIFPQVPPSHMIAVSTKTGKNIRQLKELITRQVPSRDNNKKIVGDLIQPSDFIVLVVPIDKAAPKGRLILPQQQTIRDILDTGAVSIVTKETELKATLQNLGKKPALVITDSQVFDKADKEVPHEIPLTSFSILFARYKGSLETVVHGAAALDLLESGDKLLISEGCTHHRQCGDIGTVKLPQLINRHTGKELDFEFTSGTEFPLDLSQYRLIIHCGGCMLNDREMKYRIKCAQDQNVPITNYGTAIAYMQGILKRSIQIFPELTSYC